jgi:DNA polymerase-3 subunit beta
MKANCERDELLHAFQTAASVAPSRSPKPILQNVKLEVSADRSTLLATDLEVGIRIEVPGFVVDSPGTVLLPVVRFGSILRESTDEKLLLECDGARTRVSGARSEFHLPTENPDEFPEVASFEEERYHKLPARFFRELIRRTIFATDTESSRFALGGVLVEMKADHVIGVATDGRRLARQQGPAQAVGGHETPEGTIIPARSLQVLERALADAEGEICIAARENDLLVKSERVTLYTRLVEGRFPNWRDVFPKVDPSNRIELSVGPFHSAVRQAAIVTDDHHRGVDFTFADGKAVLLARSAETGESHVEMPVAYDGPALAVMLDPRYASDFLKVLNDDTTFTLCIRDAESAVVAHTGDGYSYVIRPLARE